MSFARETVTIGFADGDASREPWELPRTCDGCGLYCLPGDERWACAACEREGREFDLCGACGRRADARDAHACGGACLVLAEMREGALDALDGDVDALDGDGASGGGEGGRKRRR